MVSQRQKVTCTVGAGVDSSPARYYNYYITESHEILVKIPHVFDKAFSAEKAISLRITIDSGVT